MDYKRLDLNLGFCPELTVLEVYRGGPQALHRKPYSSHPKDNFLEVVLCWMDSKFIVWTRNLQTGGLGNGVYLCPREYPSIRDRYLAALRFYDKRGTPSEVAQVYEHLRYPGDDDCPCSGPDEECTPECVACHEDQEAALWETEQTTRG